MVSDVRLGVQLNLAHVKCFNVFCSLAILHVWCLALEKHFSNFLKDRVLNSASSNHLMQRSII